MSGQILPWFLLTVQEKGSGGKGELDCLFFINTDTIGIWWQGNKVLCCRERLLISPFPFLLSCFNSLLLWFRRPSLSTSLSTLQLERLSNVDHVVVCGCMDCLYYTHPLLYPLLVIFNEWQPHVAFILQPITVMGKHRMYGWLFFTSSLPWKLVLW